MCLDEVVSVQESDKERSKIFVLDTATILYKPFFRRCSVPIL